MPAEEGRAFGCTGSGSKDKCLLIRDETLKAGKGRQRRTASKNT